MRVPLSSPDIENEEKTAVCKVLDSGRLSMGPEVESLEHLVAQQAGTKYAVAVNSGTSGLHLVVRGLGIKDGDEVITTPFSFIASANSILFERARPVFADIDPETFNIDPEQVKKKVTSRTKAILPVHVFGHPADMAEIMEIAKEYNLYVIEDSCEALGAKYKGISAGSFGNAGVFAFYPNKQVTTGEGGVIVTNDYKLAGLCRSMRNQGRDIERSGELYPRLGYNYRMDELSAALGGAQLRRLETILEKRATVAEIYNNKLQKIPGVEIPQINSGVEMSWFVYVIRLNEGQRNFIIEYLQTQGVDCKAYFSPIHLQPLYKNLFGFREGDFPVTEKISRQILALPFYNNLKEAQVDFVVQKLREAIEQGE